MPAAPSAPTLTSVVDADAITASVLDPARFADVFDRHYDAVRRYLAARLGPDQADDAAGDTFLEAFRRRARWRPGDPGSSALPWLLGIATNVVRRRRADEARWLRNLAAVPHERDAGHAWADVDARVTADALRGPLAAALAALRRRDRETILLAVACDLDVAQVAIALGIPEGTVKSRLHRSRAQLRAALETSR